MKDVIFLGATLHRADLRTRLPFRYGIVTMTTLPHVFLQTRWEVDGHEVCGLSAENLPPKWFTKDATRPIDEETGEMIAVIQQAVRLAVKIGKAESVFAFWLQLQRGMEDWGRSRKVPPLLGGLGTSLVERSLLDAFCRGRHTPLSAAMRDGSLGIDLGAIHPELHRTSPADWLDAAPLESVSVRHTVGMSDPLYDSEVSAQSDPHDGLPATLESAIREYGLRQFKLKLSGRPAEDEARLERTFALFDKVAPDHWVYSLDGNENFASAKDFRAAWERLVSLPWMCNRRERLLFVEQPVRRADALTAAADWTSWADAPPLIIDESDGEPSSLPTALALGYRGVSHKNCKGVFRGLANACLLRHRNTDAVGRPLMMSGEDLANLGPVGLQQDLAVQALLGNRSVERNGHHYFRGLSMWPGEWQKLICEAHGDLYRERPDIGPAVRIANGLLSLGSVNAAAFGVTPLLDPSFLPVIPISK